MPDIKILTGTQAAAYAARLARPGVISAYPITPQTATIEQIAEFVADGSLKCEFVKAESEHSVLAICITAAMTGVRTFTATSSQGLAYMHEMVYWAAGSRAPVVMANINRSMGPPWNIYGDQNDSLSERDTGWIQFYCESCQETLDTVIQSFRLGEKVALPVMINLDAFFLSHTTEPVEIPSQELVDTFLPSYQIKYKMDVDNPMGFGALVGADGYMELRKSIDMANDDALVYGKEVHADFERIFGRAYGFIETDEIDDAEIVLVTSGTITSTAREVVKALRKVGMKVGLLKIRMLRPFPKEDVIQALRGSKKVAVLDRNISFGSGGIFSQEVRDALYNSDVHPQVYSYIVGLGGRDVTPEVIYDLVMEVDQSDSAPIRAQWIGLTEKPEDVDVKAEMECNIHSSELLHPGGRGCPGCGAPLGLKQVMEILGRETMITIPACCSSIITGAYPNKLIEVPVYHTAFATAGAAATGIKRALSYLNKEKINVMAWAGDGGTYDIGIQALSGAAERNEDFIYICYDNEGYMNTGIQRSSSTPLGAVTTTTPKGSTEDAVKKDIMEIMAAHKIPYCATASIAYPEDFQEKLRKAKSIRGTKFILLFSSCPPGHKHAANLSIRIARLAVQTKVFPLYEIHNGEEYRLTVESKGTAVKKYVELQGRFREMTHADIDEWQKTVDHNWDMLMRRISYSKPATETV